MGSYNAASKWHWLLGFSQEGMTPRPCFYLWVHPEAGSQPMLPINNQFLLQ